MSLIAERLEAVRARIRAAEQRFDRKPGSVALLAVSKTHAIESIIAAAEAGQRQFGENYVQEAEEKIRALQNRNLIWHFIGPIQSNKTRRIAEHFSWVHTVDRWKIAQRLAEQRPAGLAPLNICLQVNISNESSKSGIAVGELPDLALAVAQLPQLRLRGLMAIPAPSTDFAAQRQPCARLRQALEGVRADGLELDTLSMGMSDDLEAAIAEGATIVRVGTAIFGPRERH